MKTGYTFDDVALEPVFNNIVSRLEPSLETKLTNSIDLGIPIVNANMDSVIGDELAREMEKLGSVPLFHRFTTFDQKAKWIENFHWCFISSGITEKELDQTQSLMDQKGLTNIILDVAHGHDIRMMRAIERLKKIRPEAQVIAGNVCTARGYIDLVNAGADCVKIGVGPGAACTTRVVTGFGVPQFSAVQEVGEEAKKRHIPFIADGGIRNSRDMILALASGASCVMIGKMLACTNESAAEKRVAEHPVTLGGVLAKGYDAPNKELEAKYRGQASEDFQNEFYGEVKAGTVAEGESMWAPVTGSVEDVVNELLGGYRSALTYGGARTIWEFQRKAVFRQVTQNYSAESNTRGSLA